jgi:hypothetical protein
LKRVRTWFVNESKHVARDNDETPDVDAETPKNGNYNRRIVCGQWYKAEIKAIMKEQHKDSVDGDDGDPATKRITAYQSALSKVWNSLSDEDKQRCKDTAELWNKGKSPPDVQRK